MPDTPILVLLVDDSPLVLKMLQRILATDPAFEVIGTASNGKEALEKRKTLQPMLISTDLEMPVMNGLELVKTVMQTEPLPILVLSTAVEDPGSPKVQALLDAGAVAVFPKPRGSFAVDSADAQEYLRKLRIVARIKTFKRHNTTGGAVLAAPTAPVNPIRMVVVGASTGGPQALRQIFNALPLGFPAPIVVVQHISAGFLQSMTEWLQTHCALPIRIAQQGETPQAGQIYFAPEEKHLVFDELGRFVLQMEPKKLAHCPSVDVLFQSAAVHFDSRLIAIVLTGMGSDGAQGIAAVARAGGMTIAQNEASCIVFGMPREAINTGHIRHTLTLEEIHDLLLRSVCSGNKA